MGGLSVGSNVPLIEALESEIKYLKKQNVNSEKLILYNNDLIAKKESSIKEAKKNKSRFSNIKNALDQHAENMKDHYMNILIRKLIEGDPITDVKKLSIQHSALLFKFV